MSEVKASPFNTHEHRATRDMLHYACDLLRTPSAAPPEIKAAATRVANDVIREALKMVSQTSSPSETRSAQPSSGSR